ncbi:MAG: S41 family peptidase [Candidatus Zixiibacteriota bacterium]
MSVPDKKAIIVGFISSVVIFMTLFFSGVSLLQDPMLKQTLAFTWTAYVIASEYPLPFSEGTALKAAEHGMFSMLDPFSFRMDRTDYDHMKEESSGHYGGIGITVVPRDTALVVISVRHKGPADSSGMKGGDIIIAVDSFPVPKDDPTAVTDKIRGPSGSTVHITVYRPFIKDTVGMDVLRERIMLEHIPYADLTEDSIAYIHIADFEAGASDDLYEKIEELETRNPKGYILDLIQNPGGYLHEAIAAADIFLDDGELVVGTASRSRWERREFHSTSDPLTDKPVVILTDKGTASAAEILTGAMRGVDRAIVIGDTTFGKGLVQSVFGLANDEAIRLTTSRYYFADGRFLNPPDSELSFSGLAPDIVFHDNVEFKFQFLVLSGFTLYDFMDENWEFLDKLPSEFAYPDTVTVMFAEFLKRRGLEYTSELTHVVNTILLYQSIDLASPEALEQLKKIQTLSEAVDTKAVERYSNFVRYHIRRLVVERKAGLEAAYRNVVVPGRADIRFASGILLDPVQYRQILETKPEQVAEK